MPLRAAAVGVFGCLVCAACGSAAGTGSDAGPLADAGLGTDASAPADSGGPPDSGGTPADAGTPFACNSPDAGAAVPTGATRDLRPGGTLAALLQASQPGDRILVHAGSYPAEQITAAFSGDVTVEGAPGETASFASLTFVSSSHLILRGFGLPQGLTLEGSGHFILDQLVLDVGAVDASALTFQGQRAAGACHDVFVINSRIAGGARTVFVLGSFAPSDTWNHHLTFVDDDFACGTHNCFQLSGARDILIERNTFHNPKGDGVLTAGATRIQILRNRMVGDPAVAVSAVRLATPGKEWDNYAGVENMISSDITVANNLITGWGGSGIELDAATNIRIVDNTVVGTTGFKTWARIPHDQQGRVILTGDTAVSLWNNILPDVAIDAADAPLVLNAHNLVGTDPLFASTTTYELQPASPAAGQGLASAQSPALDLKGRLRGARPDIGALQHDGVPTCP